MNSIDDNTNSKRRIAKTAEERENQLINMAFELVEKRFREGTATSQETTHFLKLGSRKHKLEVDVLESKRDLNSAKVEQIKSEKSAEHFAKEALKAIRAYQGVDDYEEEL